MALPNQMLAQYGQEVAEGKEAVVVGNLVHVGGEVDDVQQEQDFGRIA